MGKPVVHLEIVTIPASESDPDGDSYLLCGLEYADKMTSRMGLVTCKNCIGRAKKQREKREYP